MTQSSLPYFQLEDYPTGYSAGLIAARTVDGLGHRFHWATKDLTIDNLQYKPTPESRSMTETVDHIYNLTLMLLNATNEKPTVFPIDITSKSFEEKRTAILNNLKSASNILKTSTPEDFERYEMIFERSDGSQTKYPFWNLINGPIEDAIWHTGQIVSFRRAAGNPFSGDVNVLTGKLRG